MKPFLILTFLIANVYGQNPMIWQKDYTITLEDYKSPQTEINKELEAYSILSGTSIDLAFQMNILAFISKKNFNNKVRATFNRDAATIVAPDTLLAKKLVNYGQYTFDLTELYVRKLRKKMYDEKKLLSNVDFFKDYYYELQKELNEESARVFKLTDFAKKQDILSQEHHKVLMAIDSLSDFCYDCKISKRKKKR